MIVLETTSLEHRLGQQLHLSSELSELITLRILEIEQKLDELESTQAFDKICS